MIHQNQNGNILITLLIFMLVATIVISASVALIITNSTSVSKIEQGQMAYQAAESGLEEAVIQLLRNPSYSGTVNNVPSGLSQFSYTVGTGNPQTIDAYGSYHGFSRHLSTTATYNQDKLVVSSWQENF